MSETARKFQIVGPARQAQLSQPMAETASYPRYKAGTYEAHCVDATIYRDPRFKRYVARLKFQLVPDGHEVYAFLNLGNGEIPRVARGSEYRRAWIIANDGQAPKKRQVMSARMFVDKIFMVGVEDTRRRHDGRDHPEGEIYSTVKEILKKTWP